MVRACLMIMSGTFMLYVFGAPVGTFFGPFMIGGGICWLLWLMLVGFSNHSQGNDWTKKYPDSKYKFVYGEYGIAVGENQLHLCEYGYTKSYAFNDVLSWETNLSTGGEIVGGGGNIEQAMHFGIANRKQRKNNEKNTGLFVKVRDVNKPVWHINFSKNEDEEKKLQARWLEILSQTLNENAKPSSNAQVAELGEPIQISTPTPSGLYRFCQSCGAKNVLRALFFEGCGTMLTKLNP